MSQALIRHLRLFCASPNVPPVRQQDGVLAVAGVLERAGLARLLLVDWSAGGATRVPASPTLSTSWRRPRIAT